MTFMPINDDNNEIPAGNQQQLLLRYTVREAVERELTAQLSPYLQQVQVVTGKTTQLERDFGGLTNKIDGLTNVVLGNEALGIIGLRREMREISASLKLLVDQKEAIENQLIGIRQSIRIAAGVVGVIGTILAVPQIPALVKLILDIAN